MTGHSRQQAQRLAPEAESGSIEEGILWVWIRASALRVPSQCNTYYPRKPYSRPRSGEGVEEVGQPQTPGGPS